MGSVIMSCGHKAVADEWMVNYYWKEWDGSICYGSLCPKCVPVYRAVTADSLDEAKELLKNDPSDESIEQFKGNGLTFDMYPQWIKDWEEDEKSTTKENK